MLSLQFVITSQEHCYQCSNSRSLDFYYIEVSENPTNEVVKQNSLSLSTYELLFAEHGHKTCNIYLDSAPENGVKYVCLKRRS